jgi:hypothetical protein
MLMVGPVSLSVRALRWDVLAPVAFLLAVGFAYPLTVQSQYSFGQDESVYLGLAESLAAGDGYAFNERPHTVYPPGLPLASFERSDV